MLRFTKTALGLALVVLSGVAHAEFTGEEIATRGARRVSVDTVLSIGATTVMNADDAIVSVPGSGKILASANADVFCAGDETARQLVIDVKSAGDVLLDFCEQHLERRDITIKFIAEQ
jgi:hypothetical protein